VRQSGTGPLKLLICLTIDRSEALNILQVFEAGWSKFGGELEVRLKFHPFMRFPEEPSVVSLLAKGATQTETQVSELLEWADGLVTGSSTTGLEAFARGCPVLWISDLISREGAPWLEVRDQVVLEAKDGDECAVALKSLQQDTEPLDTLRARAFDFAKKLFPPPNETAVANALLAVKERKKKPGE